MAATRNNRLLYLLAAAIALAGLMQMGRVFLLRFEYGEAYPPFSTFRSDPQGMRVFFEAASTLPGLECARQIRDLDTAVLPPNATLLLAGSVDSPDPKRSIEKLERFVQSGGRLVIAFDLHEGRYPSLQRMRRMAEDAENAEAGEGEEPPARKKKAEPEAEGQREGQAEGQKEGEARQEGEISQASEGEGTRKAKKKRIPGMEMDDIKTRWLFGFRQADPPARDKKMPDAWAQVSRVGGPDRLPGSMPWRSRWYFDGLAPHWTPWFAWEKGGEQRPVAVERHWLKGSVLLLSDSYLLSNEAMRSSRFAGLLSAIIGDHPVLLIDESHLGVMRQESVGTLLRKYRLLPFVAALLVLGALYVWKNASPLVPRRSEEIARETQAIELGKDAFSGLSGLVRRSVADGDLARVSYETWQHDLGRDIRFVHVRPEAVREALAQPGPVAQYRHLQSIIHKPRPERGTPRKESS